MQIKPLGIELRKIGTFTELYKEVDLILEKSEVNK